MLKEAYEDELAGKNVEVVFVSSDQTADDAMSYFNNDHGKWLLVPHGSEEGKKLKDLCK